MVTLAELKISTRNKADLLKNLAVGETELRDLVNESYRSLYRKVINSYPNQNLQSYEFVVQGSADGYTFPSNISIYRLDGVERLFDADNCWYDVRAFQWAERNLYNGAWNVFRFWNIGYIYLVPATLRFRANTDVGGTYRIWYIPNVTDLVDESDQILPDLEKWSEYITTDATIKCLIKLNRPADEWMQRKAVLEQDIANSSVKRDVLAPQRVANVRPMYDDCYGYGSDFYPGG
jgi:hypothetical protein